MRLAIILVFCSTAMHAAMIYQNGINSQTPPVGGITNAGAVVVANSFTLASPANLAGVTYYSLECCNTAFAGSLEYYIFDSNGPTPGSAPLAQGSTGAYLVDVVYSDIATNVIRGYSFNLSSPLALSAGTTYWLAMHYTATQGAANWNLVVPVAGLQYASGNNFASWTPSSGTGAFALFDSPFSIPEPGTLPLLASGLLLGGLYRRRHA